MIKNKKKIFILLTLLIFLQSCCEIDIEAVGIFKKPYEYRNYVGEKISYIEIDGETITVFDLGKCGTRLELGVIFPIILPVGFHKNNCEIEGFGIPTLKMSTPNNSKKIDFSKIKYQLKYNNKIYDPQDGTTAIFNIPNFSEFKKAKDKTLIVHKTREDGTIITKEIPFEWKVRMYW